MSAAKKPAPANAPKYCLTLTEYGGDREQRCGEIEIPNDVFEAMQEKANAADDAAFDALLKRGLAEMAKPVEFCALENAVAANNALVQLLAEHIELERHDSGISSFSGTDSGPMTFGLFQLMNICRERLNAASKGVRP